jgi:hypothetical protein
MCVLAERGVWGQEWRAGFVDDVACYSFVCGSRDLDGDVICRYLTLLKSKHIHTSVAHFPAHEEL